MSLNFADLEIMEQIIRACQGRGAFRMEEMPSISELYGKIVQILKQEQDRQALMGKPGEQLPTILEERKS
jgi:hypothetical protein